MVYELPPTVICSLCGAEKMSARQTHLNRIYKIMSEMFNMSIDRAKTISMDDEKFQRAKQKHDKEYRCRKCRGPWRRKEIKIPVKLKNGQTTTDYSQMRGI